MVRIAQVVTVVAAVLVSVAALACTDEGETPGPLPPPPADEPSSLPSVGARIAVVLPPIAAGDPSAGELERDLAALASAAGDDVAELRTARADALVFVPDLAGRFVAGSWDLICVVGAGGRTTVAELAARYPAQDFCTLPYPVPSEPVPNVSVIELRSDELGHLMGIAAANLADGGPIGVVVDEKRVGGSGFLAGLRAAVGDTVVLEDVPDAERGLATVLAELLAAGAEVLVVDVEDPAALAPIADDVPVLTSVATATELGSEVAVTWRLRWDHALRPLLAQIAAGESVGSHRVGFLELAYVVGYGSLVTDGQQELLAAVEAELTAGQRDPRQPAPPGELPRPTADTDADADAAGTADP